MSKKKEVFGKGILLAIAAIVLVFGMTFVGCDGSTGGEEDTWTDVKSLSQLNGTWKTPHTRTYEGDGYTQEYVTETTWTINASAGTYSTSSKDTITYSGSDINTIWPSIKEEYSVYPDVTINDANHTITYIPDEYTEEPISLSDSEWLEGVQINQDGTKFRLFNGVVFIKQ